MSETYTYKQAMERLGLLSHNSFNQLKRKYPDAFVVIHQGTGKGTTTLYDKQALDKFAEMHEALKQKVQP